MIKTILFSLFLSFSVIIPAQAQGTKHYRSSDDVDLPPIEKRQVIGTWLTDAVSGTCTRSFEVVKGTTYNVLRCSDGSGGKDGQALKKVSSKKFISRRASSIASGDHYVILDNGDLSVRDKQGEIGIEPHHDGLWSSAESIKKIPPKAEDSKTLGLSCNDVGYRYGNTATNSMKGKRVNSSWDFSVPDRCKNDPQTTKGIEAGTRAAW